MPRNDGLWSVALVEGGALVEAASLLFGCGSGEVEVVDRSMDVIMLVD